MRAQGCGALRPLGAARGEDALNSWEHVALADWLESHPLPGDEALEAEKQALFEEELRFWEDVTYRPLHARSIWDSSELTGYEEEPLFDLCDGFEG